MNISGKHFREVCPSLKRLINNELKFDLKYFGYMEYVFDLEEHRTFFKKWIIRDHQLDENLLQRNSFEVACFINWTRLLTFHLGRFLRQLLRNKKEERETVVHNFFFSLQMQMTLMNFYLNLIGIILQFIEV